MEGLTHLSLQLTNPAKMGLKDLVLNELFGPTTEHLAMPNWKPNPIIPVVSSNTLFQA